MRNDAVTAYFRVCAGIFLRKWRNCCIFGF
nr:MAG TPA: hypothetical protein [Bacteriophage sp.]